MADTQTGNDGEGSDQQDGVEREERNSVGELRRGPIVGRGDSIARCGNRHQRRGGMEAIGIVSRDGDRMGRRRRRKIPGRAASDRLDLRDSFAAAGPFAAAHRRRRATATVGGDNRGNGGDQHQQDQSEADRSAWRNPGLSKGMTHEL